MKINNQYIRTGLVLFAGILLGWLIFKTPSDTGENGKDNAAITNEEKTIWTCSMHPQIRREEPGDCPICGMELIPLTSSYDTLDPGAIGISEAAVKLADIQTSVVTRGTASTEIRLYGKIQSDETRIITQPAHIPGRIEKLYVNFTGDQILTGQPLALIYSPELITAQQEILEAAEMTSQPFLLQAAKQKLKEWKLTDNQIEQIISSGSVTPYFKVEAGENGIVIQKFVNPGDYVTQGQSLFEIADLSKVWVVFDAYESDLAWIKLGDRIDFNVEALPGKTFSGKVSFIDPVLDNISRVARVRIEVSNAEGLLKPNMFVTGFAQSSVSGSKNELMIPRSSVLWTGKRSIVYEKLQGNEPAFKMREIVLGPTVGDFYVVAEGLEEGQEIVTHGTFSVDAAAQLAGKPSMMNVSMHNHSQSDQMQEHNISETFQAQLTKFVESYLGLKDALVRSNPDQVKNLAKKSQKSLQKIDMRLLSGEAHKKWMDIYHDLANGLTKMAGTGQLDQQRAFFAPFNKTLYHAIQYFELKGITVYYQFCPMAMDSKGAFWISSDKEIRNPYFGDEMPDCGETMEVLDFDDSL